MNKNSKYKAMYIALGVGAYICIKFGLTFYAQVKSGPSPYDIVMNGVGAFSLNCLPGEGTLKHSANMMQLGGAKREIVLVDGRDLEVINSDTFGKGSVLFWSDGAETICQVLVKSSREEAVASLLLFLQLSGDGYREVELISEQSASIPESPRAINVFAFVENSTNSAGQIIFSVNSFSSEDGDGAVFTAIQGSN